LSCLGQPVRCFQLSPLWKLPFSRSRPLTPVVLRLSDHLVCLATSSSFPPTSFSRGVMSPWRSKFAKLTLVVLPHRGRLTFCPGNFPSLPFSRCLLWPFHQSYFLRASPPPLFFCLFFLYSRDPFFTSPLTLVFFRSTFLRNTFSFPRPLLASKKTFHLVAQCQALRGRGSLQTSWGSFSGQIFSFFHLNLFLLLCPPPNRPVMSWTRLFSISFFG